MGDFNGRNIGRDLTDEVTGKLEGKGQMSQAMNETLTSDCGEEGDLGWKRRIGRGWAVGSVAFLKG